MADWRPVMFKASKLSCLLPVRIKDDLVESVLSFDRESHILEAAAT